MDKKLVYFLCTGNSCRSQMADGFLKALGSDKFEVRSAGLEAHGLNPRAVAAMKEAGIDLRTYVRRHRSGAVGQGGLHHHAVRARQRSLPGCAQ